MNEGGAARPGEARGPARTRRFGDALRTAGRAAARVATGGAAPASAAPIAARAAASRRTAADRADDALRSRRDGFREEARIAEPQPPPAAAMREADAITVPELHALVRTLPLAMRTFGVREGAPLALSLGRSLEVELRAAPRGLELVLRPEPRLARATEAELRGVVAALAAKGIAVARAEVRARPAGGGGPGPRVDLAAGLR
ncbi:MAG TPA: hypothetical protein VIW03_16405 [Anaeromyxobacter sp.]